MTPADRARVVELLQDPSLSFRAISRATGVSDWTIRRLHREISDDPRPMKRHRSRSYETPHEPDTVSPIVSWLMFGGFLAVLAFAIWSGLRWTPPLDSMDFSNGFYPDPSTERTDDETQFPE